MNTVPPTVLFGNIDTERLIITATEFNYFKVSDEIEIYTYSSQKHLQTCINTNSIKDLDLIIQIPNCNYLILDNNLTNESANILLIHKKLDNLFGENTQNILTLISHSDSTIQNKLSELISSHLKSLAVKNKEGLLQTLSLKIWSCQLMYDVVAEISSGLNPDNLIKYKEGDIQKIKELAHNLKNDFQMSSPLIDELAKFVEMSPTKFKNIFKDVIGISPHQFILDLRLCQAKKLLKAKELTISEIAYKVGFNHPSALTRLFKNKLGISPHQVSKRR